MKIKVYDDTGHTLYLRLMNADDIHTGINYGGGVMLVAVDHDGNRIEDGNILRITPDGTVELRPAVNPGLGLDLDENGCICLEDEEW